MAKSGHNLPFVLAETRLEMGASQGRPFLASLGFLAGGAIALSLGRGESLGTLLLLGTAALVGGVVGSLRMLISLIRLPRAPLDRKFKESVRSFRAFPTLRGSKTEGTHQCALRLSAHELAIASHLPDHSEIGRSAAAAELKARGAKPLAAIPVVPSFLPPHRREQTSKLVITASGGIRTIGYAVARKLRPLFWVLTLPAIVLIILSMEDGPLAAWPDLRGFLAPVSEVTGRIWATVAVPLGFVESILFVLANGRRHPARVLFLRKFNSPSLQKSYRRLAREIRPLGHIFGLSDRFLKDSWIRWFFRSDNLGLLVFKLLIGVPAVLVLRLFDRVRFGPPTIRKAADYRRFCHHLAERRWINFRSCYLDTGLYIRTSDEWWQMVALTLLSGSDMIILDLSEPTEAIEWEMRTITQFDLWHKVVAVCREDRVEGLNELARPFMPSKVWVYTEKGRLQDHHGFLEAELTAIHSSVTRRWGGVTSVAELGNRQTTAEHPNSPASHRPSVIEQAPAINPSLAAPVPRRTVRPAIVGAALAVILLIGIGGILLPGQPELDAFGEGAPGSTGNTTPASAEPTIADLQDRVRQNPVDHLGWTELGVAFYNSGHFADAEQSFRRAVELEPENADYLGYLAEALLLQESDGARLQEAERLFRRVLALRPGAPIARFYLATFKDMNGDHQAAVEDLIALLREAPAGAPWAAQVRGAATAIATEHQIDLTGRLPPER